jgi:cob(I)alamin adenosyltransferase
MANYNLYTQLMQTGKNINGSVRTASSARTGDNGYTCIIGEKHLPKDHPLLECLGTLDELNAFLGDAKAALQNKLVKDIITKIQKDLCPLMGIIAGMPVPNNGLDINYLDMLITKLESELPEICSFAIPGENPASAKLHIARTVCRRVERRLVSLDLDTEAKTTIVPYINRLSDLLFLLTQKEATTDPMSGF